MLVQLPMFFHSECVCSVCGSRFVAISVSQIDLSERHAAFYSMYTCSKECKVHAKKFFETHDKAVRDNERWG
jgi:hypothetical protein